MKTESNTFNTKSELETNAGVVTYFSLEKLIEKGYSNIEKMPFSIKVLLECVLRNENGREVTFEDVEKIANYNAADPQKTEFPFMPARVLLQDFTGVPAVVDLAALRSAMANIGGDPEKINPQIPVDLVIDHSVMIDHYGNRDALRLNTEIEFKRNKERYEFLHWGQKAFRNFRVIPPASGICHQVNLEYLAKVVQSKTADGNTVVYPDTLVGTDSHTVMINGIGVLGWGVGGIEAEAVMLGQPLYMLIPEVIGFKLVGELQEGVTATDLVLTITEILRNKGVVGKFVEYFGPGLANLKIPDRATVSNMGPEYGATCGFFPVDDQTLEFMRYSGRSEELIELIDKYSKAQGMFRFDNTPDPVFKDVVELDMSTVETCLTGPKRPQDKIFLGDLKEDFQNSLTGALNNKGFAISEEHSKFSVPVKLPCGESFEFNHGDVLIAAVTSCTNTSNPAVLISAGLVAKKAVEKGLITKSYVKTSLAPGSKVVTQYLKKAGLMEPLEKLGFHVAGYGCTTCIGNSGPVEKPMADAVDEYKIIAASVLSGNRNFTGRVSPHTKASYLASPPLVVAFAIAGTVDIDLRNEPLGKNKEGKNIYLKDIWPSNREIAELLPIAMNPETYHEEWDGIENSNETWNAIKAPSGSVYDWDSKSTYIQEPPFFVNLKPGVDPIRSISDARILIVAGDSVTTDHISPAGVIPNENPATNYLLDRDVKREDFNSFGSRRGNDRIMTRGTFGNIMFLNQLAGGKEGGWTKFHPTGEIISIYDAAMKYKKEETPLIVFGGKDYGMGSSRDWAAKGTMTLGIKAVIVESFERIHRSNLVGMGVLPLQFINGENFQSVGLKGDEVIEIILTDELKAGQNISVSATRSDGSKITFETICRIDTSIEVDYYRNGGILHTVLRRIFSESK